jgi:hypothetical protein
MAAPLERTRHAGIFNRRGRYVFSYRLNGKQRWDPPARSTRQGKAKAATTADVARGEFSELSTLTLHEYAREWIDRYQGTGKRGFREETRAEYRALLEKYALDYFDDTTSLTATRDARMSRAGGGSEAGGSNFRHRAHVTRGLLLACGHGPERPL